VSDDVKKRILFVDDEPAVLASFENVLRRDRSRWEMVFALGGPRARDELRRGAFDAVVSDMRMPGIDGATFEASWQSSREAARGSGVSSRCSWWQPAHTSRSAT
jgi:CheY-like chemotaxis protein